MKVRRIKKYLLKKYSRGDTFNFFQNLFLSFILVLIFSILIVVETYGQTGNITYVHDPCIIQCDDYYYVFSSGDRLMIRRSKDLRDWKFVGSVFKDIPNWGKQEVPGVTDIWAPDIFYHRGTYYLYYALSTFGSNRSRIGLATNTTLDPDAPNYKWIDQGKVFQSEPGDNFNAIDPNIVMDESGRIWMAFGSFWDGIKLIELDSTTWKPKSDAILYSIARRNAIEAPFIIRKNGYYYLFVSFDYCCNGVKSTYKIAVGRSAQITGPYKDKYGRDMLSGGGQILLSSSERWRGPGHCAVLVEGDASWLVYHAYDAENNGIPTLRINPLKWDEAGWPWIDEFTSVEQGRVGRIPIQSRLFQNFPNPFNAFTTIRYFISEKSLVSIKIYDLLGNQIETLIDDILEPGEYQIFWSPGDLASGIYLCQFRTSTFCQIKRLLVLK